MVVDRAEHLRVARQQVVFAQGDQGVRTAPAMACQLGGVLVLHVAVDPLAGELQGRVVAAGHQEQRPPRPAPGVRVVRHHQLEHVVGDDLASLAVVGPALGVGRQDGHVNLDVHRLARADHLEHQLAAEPGRRALVQGVAHRQARVAPRLKQSAVGADDHVVRLELARRRRARNHGRHEQLVPQVERIDVRPGHPERRRRGRPRIAREGVMCVVAFDLRPLLGGEVDRLRAVAGEQFAELRLGGGEPGRARQVAQHAGMRNEQVGAHVATFIEHRDYAVFPRRVGGRLGGGDPAAQRDRQQHGRCCPTPHRSAGWRIRRPMEMAFSAHRLSLHDPSASGGNALPAPKRTGNCNPARWRCYRWKVM